jgi:hypothetical protein
MKVKLQENNEFLTGKGGFANEEIYYGINYFALQLYWHRHNFRSRM